MNIHARALSFAACLTGLIGFVDAASAAVIKTQPPCGTVDKYCLVFSGGDEIPVVQSFTFNAPSAGKAAVSFHGSLVCDNITFVDKVVDFVTQIVTSASSVPVMNGPGAMRLSAVLKNQLGHELKLSTDSFNLASTRVFDIGAAGAKTFYFKIKPVRMDPITACRVYSGAFTVQFVP